MSFDQDELKSMVRWDTGEINSEIFIDEGLYRLELQRIFGRSWLFLAHESQIPNPHDFFATYMGGDPVLVTRKADGTIGAFLNVCRHRGMKVCRAEDGNAKSFMCTYHGWTYDSAGKLISVPYREEAYRNELDMEKFGLVEVAQLDTYKGLIFATFDPQAPSLGDFLGDARYYLDGWLDHFPGGVEVLPGIIKWTIHGNWKLAAEQFAGDSYHAPITHASSLVAYSKPVAGSDTRAGQVVIREGHGLGYAILPGAIGGGLREDLKHEEGFDADPVDVFYDEKYRVARERVGIRADIGGHFTLFPNFSGLPGSANMRIWHPKGPNKFEIWSFTIVEKGAPEEVKRAVQRSSTVTEGAAGVVETDDGENWDLIGQVLDQGYQSRQFTWNYAMGLGHEGGADDEFPGTVSQNHFGEGPQRNFYRRWLEFMTSEGWPYTASSNEDGE